MAGRRSSWRLLDRICPPKPADVGYIHVVMGMTVRKTQSRSVVGLWVVAQAVDSGTDTRWLLIGGALAVLAVGVVIVALVKSRHRDDYDDRLAVRYEAAAPPEPAEDRSPDVRRPSPRTGSTQRTGPTFVDLTTEDGPTQDPSLPNTASRPVGRTSPMSSYDPDSEIGARETFVDLPERSVDPVIDLTDESIDISEEHQEAGPSRDPWA